MKRKYYITGNFEEFQQIIQSIKTESDLAQLKLDVCSSGTNLVKIEQGYQGVCAIDFLGRTGRAYRHVFMSTIAYARFGHLGDCIEGEFSWSIVRS